MYHFLLSMSTMLMTYRSSMVGSLSSFPPFFDRLARLLSSASAAAEAEADEEAVEDEEEEERVSVGKVELSGPSTVTLSVFLRCFSKLTNVLS